MLNRVAKAVQPVQLHKAQPLLACNAPRRGFATEQQLKSRLRSVKNIQKITKAMKMVAASKLRQVEQLLDGARVFQGPVNDVWKDESDKPGSKALIVGMTSDRGLCGAVNSTVTKACRIKYEALKKEGIDASFFLVGEKSKAGLERLYATEIDFAVSELGRQRPASFAELSIVAEQILAQEYDDIFFIYNVFRSAIAYDTTTIQGLSLNRATAEETDQIWEKYNFEGEKRDVLQSLYEFRTGVRLYHMFVEGATSEQSSRMQAMENSTKNAGEMIGKLELLYNRTRQSRITTELIEIISGATAAEELSKK